VCGSGEVDIGCRAHAREGSIVVVVGGRR